MISYETHQGVELPIYHPKPHSNPHLQALYLKGELLVGASGRLFLLSPDGRTLDIRNCIDAFADKIGAQNLTITVSPTTLPPWDQEASS